ncbi:MAG: four helix bundle protein [Anaerolineae bacterium]|nr:four helix bundle protein [Anaerolineae bacterium]MCK4450822.1 four helix bundle protein [Anaerolineae bacterium]
MYEWWKFYAYPRALFLYELVWRDCEKLMQDRRGHAIAEQIIDSAGSISANIEEGYGRGIGTKSYLYFLRVAIGSARETKGWYFRGRRLLSAEILEHRLAPGGRNYRAPRHRDGSSPKEPPFVNSLIRRFVDE